MKPSSYLVLARKWRPQTFDEVVGQESIIKTLKSAIERDRVAHAFLFSGPRGVGKTSVARILAKALNCQSFPKPTTEPCGKCAACVEIAEGNSVDVLEIDGASNRGIDNIRELREAVRYMPASLRTKVYIIDEVHMLTTESFNALLKTLEEPPPHVKFMFATTEPQRVPATILSRCQRYDFRRVGSSLLIEHLNKICKAEGVTLPEGALRAIAREAEGSVRDALSLLDQVISFAGEELSEPDILRLLGVVDRKLVSELAAAVLSGDGKAALEGLARAEEAGADFKQLGKELTRWFRNLMIVKLSDQPEALVDCSDQELAELKGMAEDRSLETIERILDRFLKLQEELLKSGQPRLLLELALVKAALTPPLVPIEELIAKLEAMEKRLERTGGGNPAGPEPEGEEEGPLFSGEEETARPAPEPSRERPASAPSCGDGEEEWRDFLASLEEREPKIHALLLNTTFAGRSGKEWRLASPPGFPLADRLKKGRNAARLNQLLSERFGEGNRVVLTEEQPRQKPKSASSNRYQREKEIRKEALEDPVVRALQDQLGGEIKEIITE